MSQWKNTDSAANSVYWAAAQFKTPANTANRAALYANTTADAFVPGMKTGVFAADAAEAAAESAIAHAGWVLRTEGTGGRAGRVQYETLVAMGSISTDAEDTVLKDIKIFFTAQPVNSSIVGANATTFSVTTDSTPPNATIAFQWQANTGAGFVDMIDEDAYSNTDTSTLSISAGAGLNGIQYRVVATSSGANTITSRPAVLTVT